MRPFEVGLVLPVGDVFGPGSTPRWTEIRDLALRAEAIGFDIVWVSDELLWRPAGRDPQGFWEGSRDHRRRRRGDIADQGRDMDPVGAASKRRHHGQGGRDARRDQRRSIRIRPRGRARRRPGTRVRATGGSRRRPLRGGRPDHRAAAAPGSGDVRGYLPFRARPRAPARRAATGPDPVDDRREGTQDAPSRSAVAPTRGAGSSKSAATSPSSSRSSRRSLQPAPKSAATPRRSGSRPGSSWNRPRSAARRWSSARPLRGTAEAIADGMRAFGTAGFTNVELVVWPPTVAALDAMAPVLELLDRD